MEQIANPKVENTANPKVEGSTSVKVEKPATRKVETTASPKVEEAASPEVEETASPKVDHLLVMHDRGVQTDPEPFPVPGQNQEQQFQRLLDHYYLKKHSWELEVSSLNEHNERMAQELKALKREQATNSYALGVKDGAMRELRKQRTKDYGEERRASEENKLPGLFSHVEETTLRRGRVHTCCFACVQDGWRWPSSSWSRE